MRKWIGALFPLLTLDLWFLATAGGLVRSYYLPAPETVWTSLLKLFQETGWTDLFSTLQRTFAGLFLATLIGIPLGLLLARNRKLRAISEPTVEFLRSLPTTALFPLFMALFGIGDAAKIAAAVFLATGVLLVASMEATQAVPAGRLHLAILYKATPGQVLTRIIIPQIAPNLFTALRTALNLCFWVIIVAEMLMGTVNGLGQRMYESYLEFRIERLYALILVTGCTGYVMNAALLATQRRVFHWVGK